ncbi:hypothetical protein [Microvirga sp. G4-2]|uniref:hypothetical protein n=1 Tax=Microvirga sp. G4-2 TaxID=3434467 RepID=UPI004043AB59
MGKVKSCDQADDVGRKFRPIPSAIVGLARLPSMTSRLSDHELAHRHQTVPPTERFFREVLLSDSRNSEERMSTFRRSTPAKSVIFAVNYDDARTAYLWIDNPAKANDNRAVNLIARAQQEKGSLPEGIIISIKRVR